MESTEVLCTAFVGTRKIASGTKLEVASKAKEYLLSDEAAQVLIFDHEQSQIVEIDFRGTIDEVRQRVIADQVSTLPVQTAVQTDRMEADEEARSGEQKGRGRPRLGVVSREVTLLPRHWNWLNQQPGGASIALRKLVEAARRADSGKHFVLRQAQDATYRFMSAMAGNLPGFEEASRALFATNARDFAECLRTWPSDIREHIMLISKPVFECDT